MDNEDKIQYLLDRNKKFEKKITLSSGRLFGLYAENDHALKQLTLIMREQDQELKKQINDLRDEMIAHMKK